MTAGSYMIRPASPGRWIAIAGLLLLLPDTPLAVAQTTVDSTELSAAAKTGDEVDIEANTMEINEDSSQAVFSGKVDAKRGDVRLNADKLVVDYVETKAGDGSSKTEVTFLKASGGVVITTRRQKITGQGARMDVKKDQVWVEGNVKVVQGASVLTGQKLHVDLKTNRSQMTGGRVKGSFLPKQ